MSIDLAPQYIIVFAVLIDLLFGDPGFLYHPVRLIGAMSKFVEGLLYKSKHKKIAGILYNLTIVSSVTLAVYVVVKASINVSVIFGVAVQVMFIASALAINSLAKEGFVVIGLLSNGELEKARTRVQTIVSRDMSKEDRRGIIRAVIESMTENLSDAVIAPLLFAIIAGAPGIWFYKSVNTLDSLVGYKDKRYSDFGWFSARLDDVVNFVPARITGLLIVTTAVLTGKSPSGAIRAWYKDAQKGPSPNGGIPITTFAGANRIALGGDCISIKGERISIPYVGGLRKELTTHDIKMALVFHYVSVALLLSALIYIASFHPL